MRYFFSVVLEFHPGKFGELIVLVSPSDNVTVVQPLPKGKLMVQSHPGLAEIPAPVGSQEVVDTPTNAHCSLVDEAHLRTILHPAFVLLLSEVFHDVTS